MAPSNDTALGQPQTSGSLSQEPKTDNLAEKYTAAADDGGESDKRREASMLYSVAESHLNDEAADEVLSTIKDAITMFRSIGDVQSLSDSLRLRMLGWKLKAEQEHEAGRGVAEERLLLDAESESRIELRRFKASGDKYGEAAMLLSLSMALQALGGASRFSEALDNLLDAQDIARDLADTKLEALVTLERAELLFLRHRYKKACTTAREAQKLFAKVGDSKNEGMAWFTLGSSQINNGRVEEGFVSKRKALSIYRRIGNKKLEASCLASIGGCYIMEREEFANGVKAAEEACTIYRALDDTKHLLDCLRTVADGYMRMRESKKALAAGQEALDIARRTGDKLDYFKATLNRVDPLASSGEPQAALELCGELIEMARDMDDRRCLGQAFNAKYDVYDSTGDNAKAKEAGEEAVEAYRGCPRFETDWFNSYMALGRSHVKLGDYAGSLICMQRCRDIAEKMEDIYYEGVAMLGTSGAHYGLDHMRNARHAAQLARERFQEEGCQRSEARVIKLALSSYDEEEGDVTSALKVTQEGVQLMVDAGNHLMECQMKQRLAEILLADNNVMEAGKVAMEALKTARMEEDKRCIVTVLCSVIHANYQMLCDEEDKSTKSFHQQLEKLARYAKEALRLTVKLRDYEFEAVASCWVARVSLLQGKFREAIQAAETSVDLAQQNDGVMHEIESQLVLAQALVQDSEIQRATEVLKVALQNAKISGHREAEETALDMLERIISANAADYVSPVLNPKQRSPTDESRADPEPFSDKLTFRRPDESRVRQFIATLVQNMIGSTSLELDEPVMESGIDSLSSVELRTQLQQEFRVNLPSAFIFQHPTVTSMARLITDECVNRRMSWHT